MLTYLEEDFKNELYEQFSRVCKALGSARRFELVSLMVHGEYSVESLAKETGMSIPNTSQHLQNLRRAGLVATRRVGTSIRYRLADPSVFQLLQAARQTAASRLAEMDRIFDALEDARKDAQKIKSTELKLLLKKGEVFLVDVRPENEYHAGHLPGAHSFPLSKLPELYSELPKDKLIVVYCRDIYSTLTDEAINLLQEKEFKVARLTLGFLEWKAMRKEIVVKPV